MIHEDVVKMMIEVMEYASDVEDWITIKKELVKHVRWQLRTLFSRRHPLTKKQQTNEFEYEVMKKWVELGGKELHI